MDKPKPPHELKIAGGNLADRWERFLERFRWYLAAVGEDGSEDKKKVAILLTVAGAEAQEVFRTFTYEPAKAAVGYQPAVPAETAEQFNTVLRKFTEFCVPRKNVIYERYVFHTRVQSKPKLLTERRPKLKTYNEGNIETLGICIATVNHMGKKHRLQFVVVSKGRQSLIGASDSERLGLVTRVCGVQKVCTVKENGILTSAEIKKEYPDISKGLGKIHLRQNYVHCVYPARKVPQSQKQKLKKELDRLVQTGVLVKAERPTDWVLPLVIVEKPNGDLRLCLDPMDLNEYIRREHYHLPHRSEIVSEMADARYFTKMDASQGFYQIQLDEESTQLCTVATPFGRYSFKILPHGINCAPEIFHAKIQQLFESETGVKVFMDDIVVWGRTREENALD
ncbi:hypothetical protein NP493_538g00007 [Ridgeia piscesae]|uniref:Reverse transcriptase domain-containing protein n=1 Tax=Ridgeia piscesae TaxID=27915 RepID=A0AAD9KXG3_RIDPI|nr:hypothetical protein NP493_538g00007 [Ridgeia piscesae]